MKKEVEQSNKIIIPKYSDDRIKEILIKEGYSFLTTRNKINLKTEILYNRYLLLVSLIHRKYAQAQNRFLKLNNKEVISEKSFIKNFEIDLGTIYLSNVLFIDRKEIGKMLEVLVKYDIIIISKYARPFGKEFGKETHGNIYKISTMFNRKSKKIELTSDRVAEQYINSYKNYNNTLTEGKELLEKYKELITRLYFPTIEEVTKMFKKLIGTESKKGKIYVEEYLPEDFSLTIIDGIMYEEMTANKTCIYEHIDTYENWILTEGITFIYKGKDDRYYTDLTFMKSEIRKMITLDGKELIENDFVAFHNNLIVIKSGIRCELLEGNSHSKIAEKFGITRAFAKQIGLAYWNSRIVKSKTISSKENEELFSKMDNFLQTEYPSIWKFLLETKKTNHKNMSKLLFKTEREIMDSIKENYLVGKDFIYVYDCYYTTIDINTEMKNYLNSLINNIK